MRRLNRSRVLFLPLLLLGLAAVLLSPPGASGQDGERLAILLQVSDAIGPATREYIGKGIAEAEARNAGLLIIQLDTPGGLDAAMRDIIKDILSSRVPVATFVYPSGSRAASAGTYMLYASHIAAMAPATNLGAATPVQIGGGGVPGAPPQEEPEPEPEPGDDAATGDKARDDEARPAPRPSGATGGTAAERKAINDAVAYIRGLAELRGRNADWAELAVREAVSLTAEEAAAQNVIDLVAASIPQLLELIDGRVVKLESGEVTLETAGMRVELLEPDWRIRLLATITNPNIAYLLLLIGIYGLIFEGYNPGAIVPGVVGAICLVLALFSFQILPVNYAGLGLMLLGVILIVAEAFVPSFGALGLGGIAAFVFGSIILFDTDVPGMQISRGLIVSVALVASASLLLLVTMLMKIRRRQVHSGAEEMVGVTGEALHDFSDQGSGTVFVHGERWSAQSSHPLRRGDKIRVTRIKGLTLDVEPEK
ncbi:MAG: nodulation protein NfeD [Chromatiales bacterium]|nr:nodulation protein NfeD [Chromatiales bacterium]